MNNQNNTTLCNSMLHDYLHKEGINVTVTPCMHMCCHCQLCFTAFSTPPFHNTASFSVVVMSKSGSGAILLCNRSTYLCKISLDFPETVHHHSDLLPDPISQLIAPSNHFSNHFCTRLATSVFRMVLSACFQCPS